MAAASMLLLGATLVLSSLQVRFATRVEGPAVWPSGERQSLRVGVRRLAEGDWEPGFRAEANLEAGPERWPLAEGQAGETGTLALDFRVPAEAPPGPATLEVVVHTLGGESETVRVPITLGPAPPPGDWLVWRHPCEEGSRREGRGGWTPSPQCADGSEVWLYPESGHLVGNLENRIRILGPQGALTRGVRRVSQRLPGVPPPAPGAFDPRPVDPLGLSDWRLTPGWPRGLIEVERGGTPRFLRDLPTQALLSPRAVLLSPGRLLRGEVALVRQGRPVWWEVWHAGRRLASDAAWVGDAPLPYAVRLPEDLRGFVVLAAVTSLEAPAASGDRQVFFVADASSPGQALGALAEAVAALPAAPPLAEGEAVPATDPLVARIRALSPGRLARLDRSTANRAAAALLSRVEAHLPTPPPLAETTAARQAGLEAFKRRIRRPLLGGLAVLVLGGLLVGATLGLREQRGRRRRLEALGLDEVETEGRRRRISGGDQRLAGLGLVLVVLGALAALLTLLETLRWDWGG